MPKDQDGSTKIPDVSTSNRPIKNALMIAFHYPPQFGSSGIQRTLSFTKHLQKHNWHPIVLTVKSCAYERKNSAMLGEIPKNIALSRSFAIDAKRHLSFKGKYFSWTAFPDRWATWLFTAIPTGVILIKKYKPMIIWSTSPTPTAHLIALILSKLFRIPWIADFRDPMTHTNPEVESKQQILLKNLESKIIRRCSSAVFTTASTKSIYQNRYPEIEASKFTVIENGHDLDLLVRPPSHSKKTKQLKKINLVHSGVIYENGRNPLHFLIAIKNLRSQSIVGPENFSVVFRAPGSHCPIEHYIRELNLIDIVYVKSPLSYKEAIEEMTSADGLIVFQGSIFNSQLPAKVYEYIWSRNPIIGLVDKEGTTAGTLRTYGFTDLATIDNSEEISETLKSFLSKIRAGTCYTASESLIKITQRDNRARELARLMDDLTIKKN